MQRRLANQIEVRTNEEKNIVGVAARYYDGSAGTEYRLYENIYERIAPGAFDSAVDGDVVALFNHDPNLVLGRTPNTLKLWTEQDGLHYEITPDDTSVGSDVRSMISRGDVRGSSFGFRIKKQDWSSDGDRKIRTILDVELYDVSPTTYPAYESTSTDVRTAAETDWLLYETQVRLQKLEKLA